MRQHTVDIVTRVGIKNVAEKLKSTANNRDQLKNSVDDYTKDQKKECLFYVENIILISP